MAEKISRKILITILLTGSSFLIANGQEQFTPYDDLPGVIQSYKPAYSESYPAWARMLYHAPVNVMEVDRQFLEWQKLHPDEENAVVRYYKIWRRAAEPYVMDDGSIRLPDREVYNRNLLQNQLNAGKKTKSGNSGRSAWTFLGPKQTFWLNESGSQEIPGSCPWQVNMYSFDVAPSNNHILYGGSETGFMNKSEDDGMSWTQLGRDYPFGGGITAVAIYPENPDIVYVSAGNQVHKTIDGGATWTPLLTSVQFAPDRMVIDYSQPDKILTASSKGVYITTDGGASWNRKWSHASWDVEIRPDDPLTVYALSKNGSGNFEIALSSDGGETFAIDSLFPTDIKDISGGLLAVTPADPSLLFVLMLSANNTPYLYRGSYSQANVTWTRVATGQTGTFGMNNGQGYFDLVLGVSPVDPDIILAGTTTLFVSRNGGASFTAVGGYTGSFNIHPDIQDIRMLPSGKTWVSTDGGMTLTNDNFTSTNQYHARVNGLIGSDMWGFDQGWNEDIVVGGRYHNGNTAMTDFYDDKALRMGGAEAPTGWVIQGRSRHVAFSDLGSGWILPETAEGKPEGRFIFSKYPNMEEYGGRRGNLVTHPLYYGVMYLGEGNSIWKTTDMGESFDRLYTFPGEVMYLQISYSDPDILYADVVGRGLYRSEDGGYTWETRPTLTQSPNGTNYWKGKLFFAISPYDGNRLYACLQNGAWSSDLGRIYRSDDGGLTWTNWTAGISEYLKNIVVQPLSEGKDLVYLFTNSTNGNPAHVWFRTEEMSGWEDFGNNYPSGMHVNLALPFFRDSKLRVAGTGGVWESPLQEPVFEPIITPWVERPHFNCMLDTLRFDDHSILNHEGATWHWSISPAPAYLSNPDIRNPEVVLGSPGSYDVTLTIMQNGQTYSRTVAAMVSTTTCPSVSDCTNPAEVPKDIWRLLYVDSEESNYPGLGIMAFDGDPGTIWHTRWSTSPTGYPHEFQVDMGDRYSVHKFIYLPRQDGPNGRIKDWELYVGDDYENYGDPVATGTWENSAGPKTVTLAETRSGRYWKLVALSEVNGNQWASAAEFSIVGCNGDTSGSEENPLDGNVTAWPVPTTGKVNLDLPGEGNYAYTILTIDGRTAGNGKTGGGTGGGAVDLTGFDKGVYFIRVTGGSGTVYTVKVVKE
jgi:photosystem II stability/assembly factor-like uncharacterized protein